MKSATYEASGAVTTNCTIAPTSFARFGVLASLSPSALKIPGAFGSFLDAAFAGAVAPPPLAPPPPAPRSLATTSAPRFGSIFFRNISFCEAMMSPPIFSFFSVQSFIGSALPAVIATKSASERSRMQSPVSPPEVTAPLPFLRSTVHALSGFERRNRNVLPISFASAGFCSM